MIRLLAILLATPLMAEQAHNLSGTVIALEPPTVLGAVADIRMSNVPRNGPGDDSTFTLSGEGLTVELRFIWNADGGSDDVIEIEPPEGYVSVPRVLPVPEGSESRAHIFRAGVGS